MLVLLFLVTPCLSSWGDSSSFHQGCLRHCAEQEAGDCSYSCMWSTVEVMEARHGQVPHFHGKWPFVRVLGLQEPVSAVCSLLQCGASLLVVGRLLSTIPTSAPLHSAWLAHLLALAVTSLCSFLHHARDLTATELLDLASSPLPHLSSLGLLGLRAGGGGPGVTLLILLILLVPYLGYLYYLVLLPLDHELLLQVPTSSNSCQCVLQVHLVLGAAHILLWLLWLLSHTKDGPHTR